jgi:broad specificity phosphatase PhoE
MVTIIFEAHGTTTDNEAHVSSGHYDVELSTLGEAQAKELGKRYKAVELDAVFCSDLQRSYRTAEIAFNGRPISLLKDKRLRECDYGEDTRRPSQEVEEARPRHITAPFPGGESYEQCVVRMADFLDHLRKNYDGKTVMVVGHRATQYGLDHIIQGEDLAHAVTKPWKWQPGWKYELT